MNPLIVIFGATGDLTKRKIIPALHNLYTKGSKFRILGVGRKNFGRKEFVKSLDMNKFVGKTNKGFLDLIDYQHVDFSHKNSPELKFALGKIDKKHSCLGNRVFYFALPSFLFTKASDIIKYSGLLKGKGWKRVVFEKPFGHSLASARKLNKHVTNVFGEKNTYRIDHYLGKELIQNILVFRFANAIFEQVWNNKFIDHIQITASEKLGVGTRAGYYESAGAIKDMIQSHLLQVLALVAMEAPSALDADSIRNEKVKVFKSLKKVMAGNLVIGQYGPGIIDGKKVPGYLQEKNIKSNSRTETFAALKVFVNNKRWKDIPFYLRTGKRLNRYYAEINLVFKDVACDLFRRKANFNDKNVITIRIQPSEGIVIRFNAKPPGPQMKLLPVKLEYCHDCLFGANNIAAYETLLYEIMAGEQTLFARWDGVEQTWKFTDSLVARKTRLLSYNAGSDGPREADLMIRKDGHEWFSS